MGQVDEEENEDEDEDEDEELNDDDEHDDEEAETMEDKTDNVDACSDAKMYAFAASCFAVSWTSITYTDGNSLHVMPCPHDFASGASLLVISDFVLLWSRCNGKHVAAGGISVYHVVLREFLHQIVEDLLL
jgi:hypothetical protein